MDDKKNIADLPGGASTSSSTKETASKTHSVVDQTPDSFEDDTPELSKKVNHKKKKSIRGKHKHHKTSSSKSLDGLDDELDN